jgi:hypothetical protein
MLPECSLILPTIRGEKMNQSRLRATTNIAVVLVCLFMTGCASFSSLRMPATLPPTDHSSISPKMKDRKLDKIMILPPSGTERGKFDTQIAGIEKIFIRKGITPINGAITGRIVMNVEGERGQKKEESAQGLSDAERAMILAKESGADALLQIGKFDWSSSAKETRFFVHEANNVCNEATKAQYDNFGGHKRIEGKKYLVCPTVESFREVPQGEYDGFTGQKKAYQSTWLTFIGSLTDVQSGAVMASFDVQSAANWNLPADYVASFNDSDILVSENFVYESGPWLPQAAELASDRVLEKVADDIIGTASPSQDTRR